MKGNNLDNEVILAQYLAQQIADKRNKKGHTGLNLTLQEWKTRKRIMLDHKGYAQDLINSICREADR